MPVVGRGPSPPFLDGSRVVARLLIVLHLGEQRIGGVPGGGPLSGIKQEPGLPTGVGAGVQIGPPCLADSPGAACCATETFQRHVKRSFWLRLWLRQMRKASGAENCARKEIGNEPAAD